MECEAIKNSADFELLHEKSTSFCNGGGQQTAIWMYTGNACLTTSLIGTYVSNMSQQIFVQAKLSPTTQTSALLALTMYEEKLIEVHLLSKLGMLSRLWICWMTVLLSALSAHRNLGCLTSV